MVHAIVLVFLDLSVINAYILESVSPNHVPPIARTGRQKKRYRSQLDFRKQLVTQLIGDHTSRGSRSRPPIARRNIIDPARPHFPEQLQGTANCVVCSWRIISVSVRNLAVSCVVIFICVLSLVLKSIIPNSYCRIYLHVFRVFLQVYQLYVYHQYLFVFLLTFVSSICYGFFLINIMRFFP